VGDEEKESFFEELGHVFDQFPRYDMMCLYILYVSAACFATITNKQVLVVQYIMSRMCRSYV
jgi:hypothetical protein